MKKPATLRSLLGFTQEDLALLLKVDRSQLAKYEKGSRDLPLASKLLLAEMVQYVFAPETLQDAVNRPEQNSQKQLAVQRMQKENEYQQMATSYKIESLEMKYTGRLRALQLVEYLSCRDGVTDTNEGAVLRSIGHKIKQNMKSQGLDKLFQLKLKLEMLQLEKLLLEAEALKTNTNPSENKA